MTAHELVVGTAIFVAGYILGTVTGLRIRHHRLTKEVTVQLRALKAWLDRWWLLFVGGVMIVVALSAYQSVQQHNDDTARIAASALEVKSLGLCVAAYENQLSKTLPPVRRATVKSGNADIQFKRAVAALFVPGHDKRDVAAVKRALAHNIAVADQLNTERRANPYPRPPRQVCPK